MPFDEEVNDLVRAIQHKRQYEEICRFMKVNLSKTKYAAREVRNLDFNVDIDHIMHLFARQNGRCALTGWKMEFVRGTSKERVNPRVCTMDRIDSNLGYIKGNVQLTCWLPNKIKSNMTNKEFVTMCKDVAKSC